MGLFGSQANTLKKEINYEFLATFELFFHVFMGNFFTFLQLFKIKVKKVFKIWEVFWGVSENRLFFRASCFGYFGSYSKRCLSETPFSSLLDYSLAAAADLFGDERKHPRFIHFTHLQQRSASAW